LQYAEVSGTYFAFDFSGFSGSSVSLHATDSWGVFAPSRALGASDVVEVAVPKWPGQRSVRSQPDQARWNLDSSNLDSTDFSVSRYFDPDIGLDFDPDIQFDSGSHPPEVYRGCSIPTCCYSLEKEIVSVHLSMNNTVS
jgi:hypothetical protein